MTRQKEIPATPRPPKERVNRRGRKERKGKEEKEGVGSGE